VWRLGPAAVSGRLSGRLRRQLARPRLTWSRCSKWKTKAAASSASLDLVPLQVAAEEEVMDGAAGKAEELVSAIRLQCMVEVRRCVCSAWLDVIHVRISQGALEVRR
jgi:hypothetical protein